MESHTILCLKQRSFVTHQKIANPSTHRHFFDHLNRIHFLSYPATCPKLYANRQILAIKLCSFGFFVGCALLVADLSVILRILIPRCGFSQSQFVSFLVHRQYYIQPYAANVHDKLCKCRRFTELKYFRWESCVQ